MADESDMRRGEDFGGSDEQSEDQEVREEEGEETSSAPRPSSSLQAIEYDPAMLEYDDPLASMKPDVYTDTVQSGDQHGIPWPSEEDENSADCFKKPCNSIFSHLLASVSQEKDRNCAQMKDASKLYPYFDVCFIVSDNHTVLAHRIFLARCPNSLQVMRLSSSPIVRVPEEIKLESLMKVLGLLYSSSKECEWIKESMFSPEVYAALVDTFGEGEKLEPLGVHLETFLCSPLFSDATICSGPFRVPVHKVVLCSRNEYFAKAFSPNFLSSRTGETELAGVDSTLITALLDYLYTGNVEWATSLGIVADMLVLANRVQDSILCQGCAEVVTSQLDLDNCCSLYRMSQQLSQSHLWWHCTKFIVDHYDAVVSLTDYAKFEESSRKELELIHEALLLNPAGKGKGFGCIRELIGTLSESLIMMEERLKTAQELHVLPWHSCPLHAPNKAEQYSLRMLQQQEVRVDQLRQFLAVLKSRYKKLKKE